MPRKTRMVGIRTDAKNVESWNRRAKAAGLSFNKWACLMLNRKVKLKVVDITESK